jgi:hypothetical protein
MNVKQVTHENVEDYRTAWQCAWSPYLYARRLRRMELAGIVKDKLPAPLRGEEWSSLK